MNDTRIEFDCYQCELRVNCLSKPCYSRYQDKVNVNGQAEIMILFDTPTFYEDSVNIPAIGLEGALLENILKAYGRSSSEFYITHAVKCPLPSDRKIPLIKRHIIPCYENNLIKQIAIVQPKIIINFGGRFWKWISKNKTLNMKTDQGLAKNVVIHKEPIKIIPVMSLTRLLKSQSRDYDSDRYRMFAALSILSD